MSDGRFDDLLVLRASSFVCIVTIVYEMAQRVGPRLVNMARKHSNVEVSDDLRGIKLNKAKKPQKRGLAGAHLESLELL